MIVAVCTELQLPEWGLLCIVLLLGEWDLGTMLNTARKGASIAMRKATGLPLASVAAFVQGDSPSRGRDEAAIQRVVITRLPNAEIQRGW